MSLLLLDKYTWDAWFLPEGNHIHAFFLESQKTGLPDARHTNKVSIGYATSEDMYNWQYHGCVMSPGEWYDSVAMWSGCIYKKDKTYYIFYTGRYDVTENRQCICVATSLDCKSWTKHKQNPLLVPDGKLYSTKMSPNKLGKIGAFRDPFVFEDEGTFFMTFSARTPDATEYNACIGLATSQNLIDWQLLPPILAPNRYDEMEVSQIINIKGTRYLLFSIGWRGLYEPSWEKQVGEHLGLHCYFAKNLKGPYLPVNKNGVVLDDAEHVYDLQFINYKENTYGLGWNNLSLGLFIGGIADPFVFHFNGEFVGVMKPVVTSNEPHKNR